jgi:hypothetical protein
MTMPRRHASVALALAILGAAPRARAKDADGADAQPAKPAPAPEAASKDADVPITDTREDPGRRYYFVGLRYRGTVIPQFLMDLFIDEGTTVYTNTFGAEFDMRKQGQSTIPWIVYTDYSMGDTLFHQKGTPNDAGNWTVVNSSLKALYLGLDQLWSIPLDESHHWDFEFGFGVGVGVLFGDLQNDWVYENPNGTLHASSSGQTFSQCPVPLPNSARPPSCTPDGHMQSGPPAKVGGYKEPFWFSGGSVPNIFPYISFPQLDVRYKPIKQMEARLGLGFSLTGFWFGISADYGLETADSKGPKASSGLARMRDML